ncbi:hypothetical protein ACFXGA_06295 [Actinosynnema sp. NPDC059335]|uniref:hypothetical protein n=1 Tax=Actinosynnema sp. NPDC059335 TaxID=3346804 RepID=UPI00366FD6BF
MPDTTASKALIAALTRHYTGGPGHRDEDSHALYTELTAPGSTRRADLVAVSLWGSRGLSIDVHEIKVSRSDWLAELAQPSKADAWWPHSSRFWVVVPSPTIVKTSELPAGWGLMVPSTKSNARKMTVVVDAAARQPEIPLELLATFLRRDRNDAAPRLARARQEARNEGYRQGREHETQRQLLEAGGLSPEQQARMSTLEHVERLLGGKLGWAHGVDPRDAAEALAFVRAARKLPGQYDLNNAERLAQSLSNAVTEIRALLPALALDDRKAG